MEEDGLTPSYGRWILYASSGPTPPAEVGGTLETATAAIQESELVSDLNCPVSTRIDPGHPDRVGGPRSPTNIKEFIGRTLRRGPLAQLGQQAQPQGNRPVPRWEGLVSQVWHERPHHNGAQAAVASTPPGGAFAPTEPGLSPPPRLSDDCEPCRARHRPRFVSFTAQRTKWKMLRGLSCGKLRCGASAGRQGSVRMLPAPLSRQFDGLGPAPSYKIS